MQFSSELLVTLFLGLFGGGGIVAFFKLRGENAKLRSEGAKIIVDAAQGAVVVQGTVLKDIQDRLEAVENELVKEKRKTSSLEIQIARWNQWWWAVPEHIRTQLPPPPHDGGTEEIDMERVMRNA